ncbi:unnamed protein product [Polarella glacialis]|uniref:Uncharacterized protein n=1 Tax=Polarella glacialis TaxID=89957 RepID=A0A813EYK8_POLGL|nr:unnamed protein product [Polarella glacialis]
MPAVWPVAWAAVRLLGILVLQSWPLVLSQGKQQPPQQHQQQQHLAQGFVPRQQQQQQQQHQQQQQIIESSDSVHEARSWQNEIDQDDYYQSLRHHYWGKVLSEQAVLDRLQRPPASSEELATWRSWLNACADGLCSCDSFAFLGVETCACPHLPPTVGQLGRTLKFGRLIWCAAAASQVDSAADLFTYRGGSAVLLAHGMSSSPKARQRQALLWAWELNRLEAQQAARNLERLGAEVTWLSPSEWEGEETQAALEALAVGGAPGSPPSPTAPVVRALVISAAPFLHRPGDEAELGEAALIRAPCRPGLGRGVEFAVLDPTGPIVPEIANLLVSCPNLRWLAVNNVNLPHHAGWAARQLANLTGWHVLAQGEYEVPEVQIGSVTYPTMRHWRLLARSDALRVLPPALSKVLPS